MVVEYHLTDSTFRPRSLMKFMAAYVAALPTEIVTDPVVHRVGNELDARLFAEGSVRGVNLAYQGRVLRTAGLRVTLGMLASRTDWMLAYGLLRALLDEGRGVLSDGDGNVLQARDLTESEAAGLAMPHLAEGAETVRKALLERGHPFAALPAPEYDLLLTSDDLPGGVADPLRLGVELEGVLAPRALRYEQAMSLPVMQAPDGTPLAFWPWCDALVDAVPFVAVARHEDDEPRVIPGRQLFRALGDGIESVALDESRYFLYADPSGSDFQTVFERAVPFPAWIASRQVAPA